MRIETSPGQPKSAWRTIAAFIFLMLVGLVQAQVKINEIVAATSPYLTMADSSERVRPGTGMFWADPAFNVPAWRTGTTPMGFEGAAGLNTNVAALRACPAILHNRHNVPLW